MRIRTDGITSSLMMAATANFDTPLVFAGLIVIAVMGIVMYALFAMIEQRMTFWAKREWPDWRPPSDMLQRRPDLPRYMAGGPENPLGARAMYLGSTLYRIHGSNEPWTIGTDVSSGCIRLRNADVIDLYHRVPVGTKVVVM